MGDGRGSGLGYGEGLGFLFGKAARWAIDSRDFEVFGHDVREDEFAGDFGFVGFVKREQAGGDAGTEPFKFWVVIKGDAVARVGEGDGDRGIERCTGADGEGDDAVGEKEGLVDGIGDQQNSRATFSPDGGELILELGAGECVECGEWFIEQQDAGLNRECTGDGHTLTHASGELAREAVGGVVKFHHLDVLGDVLGALGGSFLRETDSTANSMFSETVSHGSNE